eukprot:COSAG06_NODE_12105_length_1423_cov_5.003776_4_plen_95_part_00
MIASFRKQNDAFVLQVPATHKKLTLGEAKESMADEYVEIPLYGAKNALFKLKTVILPRQARDHIGKTQKAGDLRREGRHRVLLRHRVLCVAPYY